MVQIKIIIFLITVIVLILNKHKKLGFCLTPILNLLKKLVSIQININHLNFNDGWKIRTIVPSLNFKDGWLGRILLNNL